MDDIKTMYKYLDIEDYFNDWLDSDDMTLKQAYEKYGVDLFDFVFYPFLSATKRKNLHQ